MPTVRGAASALLARRRLLLLLAAAALALRHRRAIRDAALRSAAAARRAATAADRLTAVAALVSADLSNYLSPSPASASTSAAASASASLAEAPPRSLRRLLSVAASADALVVLRALASAAVRELVSIPRQMPLGCAEEEVSPRSSSSVSSESPRSSRTVPRPRSAAESLLAALDTPAGARVAAHLVGVAVREAVATACDQQARGAAAAAAVARRGGGAAAAADEPRHWLDVLLAAGLSERGQAALVDVAVAVTRAAVPAVVAAHQTQAQQLALAQLRSPSSGMSSPTAAQNGGGVPRRPRPASMTAAAGGGGEAGALAAAAAASPASRQLLLTVLAMNGKTNWMERVAVLASRERGLVRDIVRTVAGEAIRAYLTTQSELQQGGAQAAGAGSPSSPAALVGAGPVAAAPLRMHGHSGLGSRNGTGVAGVGIGNGSGTGNENGRTKSMAGVVGGPKPAATAAPPESLWRVLARSLVDDARRQARRALREYLASPPEPRWLFL